LPDHPAPAAFGQGITLAQRLLVQDDLASGRLVEIWQDPSQGRGGFYLIWPKARKSAARDALIDWILAQIKI